MTITPNTDAAMRSVEIVRELYERRQSRDPVQRIRERMSCEVNAAVLIGLGELLDRQCGSGALVFTLTDVLASAVASITLTIANGDEPMAMDCVRLFSEQLQQRAQIHVLAAPERGIVGSAVGQPVAGRA